MLFLCFDLLRQFIQIDPAFRFLIERCLQALLFFRQFGKTGILAGTGFHFGINGREPLFKRRDIIIDGFEFFLLFKGKTQLLFMGAAGVFLCSGVGAG